MGQPVGGGTATITYTRPLAAPKTPGAAGGPGASKPGFQTATPSGPRPAEKTPFDFGNAQKQKQDHDEIDALMDKNDVDGARNKFDELLKVAETSKTSVRLGRQREGKAVAKELVARLNVKSKTGPKDFWSGNKHLAGDFAKKDGHTILEQTNGARVTDDWGRVNNALPWMNGGEQLWGGLSAKYASDADAKNLRIAQIESKFPFGGDIWRNYEWPQVKAQGKVETIDIYRLDNEGNVVEKVHMDPKTERVYDDHGNVFMRDTPTKGQVSRVNPEGKIIETQKTIDWFTYENTKYDPKTGEITQWRVSHTKDGEQTTTYKNPDGSVAKTTVYDLKTKQMIEKV